MNKNDELIDLVQQAIDHIIEGKTGKQWDNSWLRPRILSRAERSASYSRAFEEMQKVKEILEEQ